jgi:MFS family permease
VPPPDVFHTDLPARLDRLPWSGWHWRVVLALGVTWVLDGLEVTIVGSLSGALREPYALGLSEAQVGASTSAYLGGAIAGALVFGRLTDLYGRKRLFLITLALYLVATALTAFSWGFAPFAFFRFLTGLGIGGEYAAINSAIDELIPARARGRVDLAVNGSYWVGTALGAAASLALLDPSLVDPRLGWRLAFGLGASLGAAIALVRRYLPESPRWLLVRGRVAEAEAHVAAIERQVAAERGPLPPPAGPPLALRPRGPARAGEIARTLFVTHRRRSALGLALMVAQAFFYNAIFFSYPLVLGSFYGVAPGRVGAYLIPFAVGNFVGPLALGRLFDTVGRRAMTAATYGLSALCLVATGVLFLRGALGPVSQTALWSITFFFASSAASAAYLTVSEVFPLELRGMAIAVFYAIGTAAGGLVAPWAFAALVATGRRADVFYGYAFGSALMAGAAAVALWLGVDAEGKPIDDVAPPLASDEATATAPPREPPP